MNEKNLFDVEIGAKAITAEQIQEEEEGLQREELIPLFEGSQNPNHSIFVVPTQEGADKDDQWNGSIGDATMEHIFQNRHKMLEMEHFIYTPNGNIFRTEFTVAPPDEDGQRSFKQQMIKVMTAPNGRQAHDLSTRKVRQVSAEDKEKVIEFLKQEIEESLAAKAEKQDAMDQVVMAFDDWESNPQMTNAIDIPSTPPLMYIYAGNTSQMFYDWVAEDHPDVRRINSFLSMANSIDWDRFTQETVEFFKTWLYGTDPQMMRKRGNWEVPSVADRLMQLCRDIANTDKVSPTELAIEALKDIESEWLKIVAKEVKDKWEEDPIVLELKKKEEQLIENKKIGKLSWAELGKFGQTLYKRYGTRMSSAHWALYKELKKKYAPEVRLGKIDVNRANMNQLREFFRARYKKDILALLDSNDSDEVFERKMQTITNKIENLASAVAASAPYMTLEDLASKGLITIDDIGYTDNNVVLISMVKKGYRESLNVKSLSVLGRVAQQIITLQRKKPDQCTEQEWYAVWQAYRICKARAGQVLGIGV